MTNKENLEAHAAYLRHAFNEACRTFPHHIQMPEEIRRWWSKLYAAITQDDAGLDLLGRLRRQQDLIERLGDRCLGQSQLLSKKSEKIDDSGNPGGREVSAPECDDAVEDRGPRGAD